MKRNLIIIFCIGLLMTTCKKETHFALKDPDPLIGKAQTYFKDSVLPIAVAIPDNPRIAAGKRVNWDQAVVINLSRGKAVLAPIQYKKDLFVRTTQGGSGNFNLNNLVRLLVYQSNGAYHAEVVTALPDTNYLRHPQGNFSGMVYVEDWGGHPLHKYLYEGKHILKYAPNEAEATSKNVPANTATVAPSNVVTIEVCYQITGYNYSTASPNEGYAWSETPVCRPSMAPVDDDPIPIDYGNVASGGGSASANPSSNSFTIAIGHNLITNISDYFKCFTNTASATYQVMVCVDQPKPGSRTAWTFTASDGSMYPDDKTNPVGVGHVFLVFTENLNGSTVVRNVGFYPRITVTPFSPIGPGMLNNDEMHPYNISGSFTVNSSLFYNMLAYITQNGSNNYDLNDNNCTNFAINTLSMGHIYLPSTYGYWLNGMGVDPGDLGEDIRATNFVGMTRSIDQAVHMNEGICN